MLHGILQQQQIHLIKILDIGSRLHLIHLEINSLHKNVILIVSNLPVLPISFDFVDLPSERIQALKEFSPLPYTNFAQVISHAVTLQPIVPRAAIVLNSSSQINYADKNPFFP